MAHTIAGVLTRQKLARTSAPVSADDATSALSGIAVPLLAIAFVAIFAPMLNYTDNLALLGTTEANRIENKIFWPLVAAAALFAYSKGHGRLSGMPQPAHLTALSVLLAFCGLSCLWAFKPELSVMRYTVQLMICSSIVLPLLVAPRNADIIYGAFLVFALAAIINVFYIQSNNPAIVARLQGYPGYFDGKNYLGEFMGIAFILAVASFVHYRGATRVLALVTLAVIAYNLLYSNSKTATALAFICPIIAATLTLTSRLTRLSPSTLIAGFVVTWYVTQKVLGISVGRISYAIYNDATLSGRTSIWDFLNNEIAKKWLFGWGYGSFWLVGSDGPVAMNAPGWIATMPSGHNGYLDVNVEIGLLGLVLFLVFVFATLHSIAPLVREAPKRAWALLALATYVLIYNFIESAWLRGFEIMWLMFLAIAAETVRWSNAQRLDAGTADQPKLPSKRGIGTARRASGPQPWRPHRERIRPLGHHAAIRARR